MSKSSRLISFLLTLILTFSFFTVNSLAAEDSNLVDSNLSNWVDYGENSSLYQSANVSYLGNNTNYITVSGSNKVVVLYDLTEFLKIGESYEFSFFLPNTEGLNNNALNSCQLSWYLCDGSNIEFPIAGEEIFRISINNSNKSNYLGNTTAFEFTYTQGFKNTCLCLSIFPGEDLNAYNYLQLYISNVKLERIASESEKKLDGILEWLQELWDSIVNGFSNLGNKLTNGFNDLSNSIRDAFSDFASTIVNYILYFQDEPIEENPFMADDDSTSDMLTKIQNIVDYINEASSNITSLIDSMSGGVYLFNEFVSDNGWLLALCVFALTLLVFTRFIGL